MDRVFCLSDTFDSNKKMLENLEIRPEDILSPNDPDAVDKIVAEIDKERDDLLEYRESETMEIVQQKVGHQQSGIHHSRPAGVLRPRDEAVRST